MDINIVYPDERVPKTGAVVVVDVLRAFSTAAFAFNAGASEIVLVGSIAEAQVLKNSIAGAKTMGEVEGVKVPEFDFGNSPLEFHGLNLAGAVLIQRTTAGTQGVIAALHAEHLLAGSFVCAGATARYLKGLGVSQVSFYITGRHSGADGDEDQAYADYTSALLADEAPAFSAFARRVRRSSWGEKFGSRSFPWLSTADLESCLQLDRFGFAMTVERRGPLAVLKRTAVESAPAV